MSISCSWLLEGSRYADVPAVCSDMLMHQVRLSVFLERVQSCVFQGKRRLRGYKSDLIYRRCKCGSVMDVLAMHRLESKRKEMVLSRFAYLRLDSAACLQIRFGEFCFKFLGPYLCTCGRTMML